MNIIPKKIKSATDEYELYVLDLSRIDNIWIVTMSEGYRSSDTNYFDNRKEAQTMFNHLKKNISD